MYMYMQFLSNLTDPLMGSKPKNIGKSASNFNYSMSNMVDRFLHIKKKNENIPINPVVKLIKCKVRSQSKLWVLLLKKHQQK